ncbi:hypothetical protein SAMN02746065_11848 [Desulfocicer vacuolatum DSM 3385]|uniref:Uncharacterized protein n=1 Tax=Desulfocicer vacuolatum DSM 3385 TaxID=1121400 RepID=A0A1W2DK61_9BACT|nr:hypothetical protein SAMN02746065_11848 [Desulfocicer vacuolatum DSM 3385]
MKNHHRSQYYEDQSRGAMSVFGILSGFAWVIGLLLAGSDGPLMPWGNVLGVFIFIGASCLLTYLYSGNEKVGSTSFNTAHSSSKEPATCSGSFIKTMCQKKWPHNMSSHTKDDGHCHGSMSCTH